MITLCFEIAANLFDSILAIWFVTNFCKIQTQGKWQPVCAVIAVFSFTLLSDRYMTGYNVLSIIITICIIVLYTILALRKITFKQILGACIFLLTLMLVSSLLFTCMSTLASNFMDLLQGSNSTIRYIHVLLHKIILFAVLKLILSFFSIEGEISKLNALLTFSISMSTVFGLGATMYVATLEEVNVGIIPISLITISFVLTNVILYIMLAQIQRLQKSEYELKLIEEKMAAENVRHEDATALWEKIRNLQHDMKHHLSIISAQLEVNDFESSKRYIHQLLPCLDGIGRIIRSDNKTLDYIINSKLGVLKNTQIIITGSIGDISDIKEKDLASMLGNILDNAIEAITDLEEKRIELLFTVDKTNRIIICKNTIGSSVLKNNPMLHSTKKDNTHHGLGHKIVENIVHEYHGLIDYFEEDDYFGVQIVIPGPMPL